MKQGERARMMAEAQGIASDPRAWYALMKNQMRNHDEITKSGWLHESERTAAEIKQHWYAGTLLGFDTMKAADRYIEKLETMLAMRTPELTELPSARGDRWGLLMVVLFTQGCILALGGWLALTR